MAFFHRKAASKTPTCLVKGFTPFQAGMAAFFFNTMIRRQEKPELSSTLLHLPQCMRFDFAWFQLETFSNLRV